MKLNKYPQFQKQPPVDGPDAVPSASLEIDFASSADEVARRAYFNYENMGSLPGHDVQHWLQAEAELNAERALTRTHASHKHI